MRNRRDSRESGKNATGDLLIGDLAQASGAPAKTIRFYEEIGLVPPARRDVNGYRLYDAGDVDRLRFIRSARTLDFSLEALREVLALRDQGEAPCRHVMDVLEAKATEVEERIRQLQVLREDLQALRRQAATLPDDDIEMKHCVCDLIRTHELDAGH